MTVLLDAEKISSTSSELVSINVTLYPMISPL